jgi:hypothetical protein
VVKPEKNGVTEYDARVRSRRRLTVVRVAAVVITTHFAALPTDAGQSLLRVGAAVEDMTPVPGFPNGGHGREGAVSRAFWGNLTATAVYFETRNGDGLALVSCDLFAIPAGLHATVAERLRSPTPGDASRPRTLTTVQEII